MSDIDTAFLSSEGGALWITIFYVVFLCGHGICLCDGKTEAVIFCSHTLLIICFKPIHGLIMNLISKPCIPDHHGCEDNDDDDAKTPTTTTANDTFTHDTSQQFPKEIQASVGQTMAPMEQVYNENDDSTIGFSHFKSHPDNKEFSFGDDSTIETFHIPKSTAKARIIEEPKRSPRVKKSSSSSTTTTPNSNGLTKKQKMALAVERAKESMAADKKKVEAYLAKKKLANKKGN